jgi:hypothetical protein
MPGGVLGEPARAGRSQRNFPLRFRLPLWWRGVDSNFPFRARSAEKGTFSLPIDIWMSNAMASLFGELLRWRLA